MNVEIANNLVKLRKKNGLSQEELAEKIGVSRQAVSKWERAESSPDTDNLIALAKVYDMPLDDMIKGKYEKSEQFKTEQFATEQFRTNHHGTRHFRHEHEYTEKDGKPSIIRIFPYPVFIVILYLFLGIVWDLWSPGWLLFLTIPIWGAFVSYFTKRNKK